MRVLIAVGSRHGSTWAIADEIASMLEASGHETDIVDAGEATTVAPYGAVVVGSAVYMGQWTPESRGFVRRFRDALDETPTFVFSSGPIGGNPREDAPGHTAACEALLPHSDRVFAGSLERAGLNLLEKSIIRVIKAPEGDFRDWDAIAAWAEEISDLLCDLQPMPVPAKEV